jgi:methionyl-tRNA formyltransferase
MKRRVIVLGKGILAQKVAAWFLESPNYSLELIVPNVLDSAWQPSLRSWAEEHHVPCVMSGHVKDIEGIEREGWSIDLAVSVNYDKIIKDWCIRKCGRIINIHNSPLPKYRGMNPINWSLKNGEREHGITIHNITPDIDAGEIVSQALFPINPKVDEVIDVYERCLNLGWKLFKETMPALWTIKPQAQDHAKATYYRTMDARELGERRSFTRAESTKMLDVERDGKPLIELAPFASVTKRPPRDADAT